MESKFSQKPTRHNMVWSINNKQEAQDIKELSTMSDRAAAIVGAVLLDNRLENNLKFHLVDLNKTKTNTLHHDIFNPSGTLGGFSAKINMGYMLGLYTEGAWRDMDYIREIRNSFAHESGISFSSQSIRDRVNNIKWFERYLFEYGTKEEDTPQNLNSKLFEKDLHQQLSDPRNRYLLAVRFYVGSMMSYGDARTNTPLCRPRI